MRTEMEAVLKESYRDLALKMRHTRNITQNKMAEALVMSERSYEDIEGGHNACGALTICLLLLECENTNDFLAELREKLEAAYLNAKVPV